MHFYLNKRKAIFAGVFILLLHPFDEGSLLADAPLVAGYERLKQDDQSTSIERGELLLGELNCTSCHEADATITARVWPRTAPDLSTAGARLTPHYLQSYLSDPQSKKSGVTMPNIFHASEAAAKDGAIDFLVHFLASQGGGLKPNRMGGSDSLVEQGRKLFHGVGCVACHGPEEAANDGMRYQSLDSLPEKTTLDALVEFLKDPHATRPSGRMPDLRLDASEGSCDRSVFVEGSVEQSPVGKCGSRGRAWHRLRIL
jgi:cytochrome c553